jgi:hypothetical protein
MRFSSDGAKWVDSVTFALQDSKGSAMGKDTNVGGATVSAVSTELAPDNESVTIMPEQKSGKKQLRAKIRTKDGKEIKVIEEYQKP